MLNLLPQSLVLVGAGKMGGAMLEGWIAIGVDPASISIIDPHPSAEITALAAAKGMRLNPAAESSPVEVIVLATKPQMLDMAAIAIAGWIDTATLVISVLAGKRLGDLVALLPTARGVVRAMPNLPASVGRGATAAVAGAEVTIAQRATADALLASIGTVEWLEDEALIDAVTAVSGSGPAYVFHLVECLAAAGAEAGLPMAVAERLARATVEGAGELMFRSPLSPATLRQNVTSPGGTTAAALMELMGEDGMASLMRRAVEAARQRAGELSG